LESRKYYHLGGQTAYFQIQCCNLTFGHPDRSKYWFSDTASRVATQVLTVCWRTSCYSP